MKHLYAPWRKKYLTGERNETEPRVCAFCKSIAEQNDQKHYILQRYTHCFAMLNLYPYNAGHILVIPYAHQPTLEDLTPETRAEIIEVTTQSCTILKQILKAEGINIGLNIGGKVAGGSIPEHLHMHVLPRWAGDTNFLSTLAETKQISVNLPEIYAQLKDKFISTNNK